MPPRLARRASTAARAPSRPTARRPRAPPCAGSVAAGDDGNCQFRSLSQQLYGSEDYHGSVRRAAVEHMRKEADFFGAMFEGKEEFEAYAHDMAHSKTWGDELTLRAVADALRCTVHVVTSNEANWYLQYTPANDQPVQKHLFLTYVAPVHYDALALL